LFEEYAKEQNMHRILFPDYAELDRSAGGRDLTKLFHMSPLPSHAKNETDSVVECDSIFSKHRIRKIGVAAQFDQNAAEKMSHEHSSSTKQLLNSEIALLQSTIQNKEVLLTHARQEMHELKTKMEQQNAEKRSLKNQVIEMKEAAARAAEQHAIEIQNYLAKVLDAEEKTLQANSAMELAANVHRAAVAAQKAASSTRFENSAFKRDKDRLIHLLSLFEPAKALASHLQQIPSHYFPLPGIGSSAISSITKALSSTASCFVKPLVSKKLTVESSFWMSSKIANVVLGWGAEHNIDSCNLMPMVGELHKLWSDHTKRAKEFASVSRLRKNKTAASTPRDLSNIEFDEGRPLASRNGKRDSRNNKQSNISYSTMAHEQGTSDSSRSLNSWGNLLESGMSRLRMKSQMEEGGNPMLNSQRNLFDYPESNYFHMSTMSSPKFEDHRKITSTGAIRSFCKSDEQSLEKTHDLISSELLESLKREMLPVGDIMAHAHLLAGKQSP
jgi:hypothetical protein